jgi:Trehalase-like, N-terminal
MSTGARTGRSGGPTPASEARVACGTRSAHAGATRSLPGAAGVAHRRIDGYAAIDSYAAIGDGRTIALVSSDGSIDWLPVDAIDGPTVFGALLDPRRGGCFALAPTEDYEVQRRYLEGTNVLETTFTTASGSLAVTDALNLQDGGQLSWIELVRRLRGVCGQVRMRYALAPRFDFGARATSLERRCGAIVATCGSHNMAFCSWEAGEPVHSRDEIGAELELGAGSEALLACVFVKEEPIPLPPREEIEIRLARTSQAWRGGCAFTPIGGRGARRWDAACSR